MSGWVTTSQSTSSLLRRAPRSTPRSQTPPQPVDQGSEDNGRDACRSSHDFFPDVHLERACATSGQRPVCANSRACDRELFAGSRQQPRLNSPLTNIKFARPRLVGGSVRWCGSSESELFARGSSRGGSAWTDQSVDPTWGRGIDSRPFGCLGDAFGEGPTRGRSQEALERFP